MIGNNITKDIKDRIFSSYPRLIKGLCIIDQGDVYRVEVMLHSWTRFSLGLLQMVVKAKLLYIAKFHNKERLPMKFYVI